MIQNKPRIVQWRLLRAMITQESKPLRKSLRGMRKDGSVQFEIDQIVNAELAMTWREKLSK